MNIKKFFPEKAFWKMVLTFAIPIAMQNMSSAILGIIDVSVISNMGETAVAAGFLMFRFEITADGYFQWILYAAAVAVIVLVIVIVIIFSPPVFLTANKKTAVIFFKKLPQLSISATNHNPHENTKQSLNIYPSISYENIIPMQMSTYRIIPKQVL